MREGQTEITRLSKFRTGKEYELMKLTVGDGTAQTPGQERVPSPSSSDRAKLVDRRPDGDIDWFLPPRVARRLQAADAPTKNHTQPSVDWAAVSSMSIMSSQ
ncbi:hypothetical protein J7T55_004187 [Diaporthe amygdali]|uniref:uncharacterized protein n=1 Tax=Phomopsis amygdali TaxID=1214568 RepID=UPI0022FE2B94|nr:uncharacterized protein J7T55_004187 [Diaporthe amygdali]KAJ0116017.1 hypothetical protein J7T55_004187 [Diaporthe amygdali]